MSVNYIFSLFFLIFKLFFNLKMDSLPAKGFHPLWYSAYLLPGFINDQGRNRHIPVLNAYTHLFSSPHKLLFLTIIYMHHLWFLQKILAPGDDKRERGRGGGGMKPNPGKIESNTCSVRAHFGKLCVSVTSGTLIHSKHLLQIQVI